MKGVMLGDKPSSMSWEEWGRIENSANIYNNAEELLKVETPITPSRRKKGDKTPITPTPDEDEYYGNDPL